MKRISKEDRAGLYVTVIVHLVILIILLACQLSSALKKEESFVLDFTRIEQLEKLQKELAFKEEISKRLEKMIAEGGSVPIRNVSVNRSALKDDRGTDAEKLYKDAEQLQKELKNGFKAESEDYADISPDKTGKEEKKKENYSGPSVLSYELGDRKASHLPIPAYRCMGAGEVKVIIGVDNSGKVMAAKIDDTSSSKDGCLRSFAIRAARLSRFSASQTAPARHQGYIIYQFIAQ